MDGRPSDDRALDFSAVIGLVGPTYIHTYIHILFVEAGSV